MYFARFYTFKCRGKASFKKKIKKLKNYYSLALSRRQPMAGGKLLVAGQPWIGDQQLPADRGLTPGQA
jgi:hypothetical protein